MPRQSINDITPAKRTIRDIPVPAHRREREVSTPPPPPPPPPPPETEMKRKRRFPGKKITIIIGLVALVFLGFLARELFVVHATVSVVQKKSPVLIDGTFIAKKAGTEKELSFDVISSSKEVTKSVPVTGEKKVETRASGTIVIYNNYSSASQRLIKNTRFETTDGRIYRIDESVTVPGKDKNTGTPGSIETLVYADTAGSDYNIGLSDFTIPGFKNDPRYTKFFARSKTPMAGGFIGTIKTASASDLQKAEDELRVALKDELTTKVVAEVPQGSVLFSNAIYLEYEVLSPKDSSDVKIKGTAYGVTFNSKKLSQSIAEATLSDYDGSDVVALGLEKLTFTPVPQDVKPWQTGVVSFSLKGTTTIVWQFDQVKLKTDLLGQQKEKSRIATILESYPSIDHAEVVVRPFWKGTLPEKIESISVEIVTTEVSVK